MQLLLCDQLSSSAVMSHGSANDADQNVNWSCRFDARPESQECASCDASQFAFVTRFIFNTSGGNDINYALAVVDQLSSGAVMSHGAANDADQNVNGSCRFHALPESQECASCDPSQFAFVTLFNFKTSAGNQINYAHVVAKSVIQRRGDVARICQ